MTAADHPTPTDRARELVRGALRHARARRAGLRRAAHHRRRLWRGAAGARARRVRPEVALHLDRRARRGSSARPCPGSTRIGAITLNRAVGGLNPLAVEIAAREGARIVWLPTVELGERAARGPRRRPGRQGRRSGCASSSSCARPGVAPRAGAGRRRGRRAAARGCARCSTSSPATTSCSRTGHLSRDEIFALVDGAVEAGVETIVVTHPEFPSQRLPAEDQVALAERGALMERAFTTPYTGKCTWEQVFAATRAVGAERTVWSTDLGQVFNPPVEDGLAIMADRFLEAGFSEEEVRTMAVTNTRWSRGQRGRAMAAGMSRRIQVIGAHSADFVWRAGGAIAKAVERGRRRPRSSRSPTASAASPASCGSRRARRSRTSSASATPRPRRAAGALGATVPLPGPRRLPAADRRRRAAEIADAIRAFAPDVLDHPHRHATRSTPTTRSPTPRSTARAGWPPAPGVPSAFATITPPALFLFEPHQPELCNFTPTTFVDITSVIERKQAAMARDEGPAVPADLLRPARRAARQPRAARLRRPRSCSTPRRSSA